MKQVLIHSDGPRIVEVPAPGCSPGRILVRTVRSCISPGTELAGVKQSSLPLWRKALDQPHRVARAVRMVEEIGFRGTWEAVKNKVSVGYATGYSTAGIVVEVGEGVQGFLPGDRVACSGAQCAHHAEFIEVPKNLVVPVPDGVGWDEASSVAIGAIALQGVRRAAPTLGETFLVIGLGAIGQITAQLLKSNGCKVVAADLDESRVEIAIANGCEHGFTSLSGEHVQRIAFLTGGIGVDGVIICASSKSNEIVHDAFSICRKKGRVVLVGDVGLDLRREDFYAKEIDFLISSSYGPGRYDREYEENGLDYPSAFVRWTEGRNMAEYLEQVSRDRVRLSSLPCATRPLTEVGEAYGLLSSRGEDRVILSFLDYGPPEVGSSGARLVRIPRISGPKEGLVRVGVVGAGGFTQAVHLPNLKRTPGFKVVGIANRRGHSARIAADLAGAEVASTSAQELIASESLDAVLVATRHDLHAELVLEALTHGKHVLVEKPLCLTRSDLERIDGKLAAGVGAPVLLAGHNRRFSPHFQRLLRATRDRVGPVIVVARMNAGFLPPGHWVHGDEGGGRNIGEACHYYDLFVALCGLGAKVSVSHASPKRPFSSQDNFQATLTFPDGSVCTLLYVALGHPALGKERIECFWDGKSAVIDDWKETQIFGSSVAGLKTSGQQKGHAEELFAFGSSIRTGGAWPVPWEEQRDVSRIAFDVQDELDRA